MLWYKSWLETRWRFLIGLGLLICSAWVMVFTYPQVLKLMPMISRDGGGELGQRIREAAELARTFRGFVWSDWFHRNHSQLATLFAILLGTASLLRPSGGALYLLSLPVSRQRLVAVRATTGLAELLVLALLPALLIPILAPAIEQTYGAGAALVHGVCLFVVAAVFYNFAFLLSTIFSDPWRPPLIAGAAAIALSLTDRFIPFFRVMSAESYFRRGALPWGGLLAAGAIAAALYYAAAANLARRDV
ncbi:MAG TPA: hypothetical protein VGQ36_11780 [Thermoanaerobaculia bacterium]|jgi:hypothetical protein|nr:hypothetical protein [Thermoanaerobaculia bacterium]